MCKELLNSGCGVTGNQVATLTLDHLLSKLDAATTTGAKTQPLGQFTHVGDTLIHGGLDLGGVNAFADTYNHGASIANLNDIANTNCYQFKYYR
jgi:hypothetical protein